MRRVIRHFRSIVCELRARDVSHLTESQQQARRTLLERLSVYGRAGIFPKNLDFHDRRMPYFVDAIGTRCAVAHLVESSGEEDLMWRVARTTNNAFVRELAGDAEIERWAAEMGFTHEELVRIQPSYDDYCQSEASCFCGYETSSAVAEGKWANGSLTVEVVHGDAALLTVGQMLTVQAPPETKSGDTVIAAVSGTAQQLTYQNVLKVTDEGNAVGLCGWFGTEPGPEAPKSIVIKGMLAVSNADPGQACVDTLTKAEPDLADERCSGSGCSIGGGVSSPLFFGACALALASWTRRRMRARRRRSARALRSQL